MKKIIFYTICILVTLCLVGCSNSEYHIEKNLIKEISGTEQLSGDFNNVILNNNDIDVFIDNIERLHLKKTLKKSEIEGGKDFFFIINYEDGKQESISLSNNEVTINRYIYRTNLYNKDNFITFFD